MNMSESDHKITSDLHEHEMMLMRGCERIIQEQELIQRLRAGGRLRIKAGFDPTAPDLHLGHSVLLTKLRQFQDLGHEVIFLIGDFTGRIGDPSGRDATRSPLSDEQVVINAQTYQEQVFKILDPKRCVVDFNSRWMSKMTADALIRLASHMTVARMLERDDFKKRFHQNHAIAIHEFLYPLIQGYDSVELKADVELGGTDQTFNLLMGRQLQVQSGQKPQVVMTLPLLEGLDGVRKMSKSLGNYVGLTEAPADMMGKLMSISDEMMWRYLTLLTCHSETELNQWRDEVATGLNPMEIKFRLAQDIITQYHGAQKAINAKKDFIERFRHGRTPQDLLLQTLYGDHEGIPLARALRETGLVTSTSEALRMIGQGGVRINGVRMHDPVTLEPGDESLVLQVGKRRFAKVQIQNKAKLQDATESE